MNNDLVDQWLAANCAHIHRHGNADMTSSSDAMQRIFSQLQGYQREMDFWLRYQGKRFPVDDQRFTLGGHMAELGCIHIDFQKVDGGWVLDNIWICR
jgi:hypothetical protein